MAGDGADRTPFPKTRRMKQQPAPGFNNSPGCSEWKIRSSLVAHAHELQTLRRELEAAGFKLVAEGNFWRNPGDPRDFSTQQPMGPVDNFVLKFQKPH